MDYYKVLIETEYDTFEMAYDNFEIALEEYLDWIVDVTCLHVTIFKYEYHYGHYKRSVVHEWNHIDGETK